MNQQKNTTPHLHHTCGTSSSLTPSLQINSPTPAVRANLANKNRQPMLFEIAMTDAGAVAVTSWIGLS